MGAAGPAIVLNRIWVAFVLVGFLATLVQTLRLTQGFSPNLFAERTGLALNAIEQPLNAAEAKGLLYRDHQVIRPTERGLCFLNDLQQMFLED